ncbi:uroporphyrinogen-iii synthase like protein [Zymoseptoria brevis]|uniref:Uroporphyrinogen-iii synthase like protein n=1 Tax=Zymoseptoria brevis TaxID=1047168 RepID=A0A0F4GY51_9PEZI|nr:uroporphyrinogen-iii synthase like protein [Zymoseptoria brevis]
MEDVTARLKDLTVGQTPVYLLKTISSPNDAYEEHFTTLQNGHFKPVFVPVLDHMFRDDALRKLRLAAERYAFAGGSPATARQKACNNPAKRYGGMIFTSQRAVDAFASVVAKLNPARKQTLFDKDMPIYVVGPATAKGVKALDLPCPIIGEQTGNGDALAQFILGWHKTLSKEVTYLDGRKLPLLFLVGEQRRDIIPKTLQSEEPAPSERIPVTEVVVYETGEMTSFEEDFTLLLREAKAAKVKEQWIVVFSPQGCEAMLSALGWLDEKTGKYSAGRREIVSGPMTTRIATIGPTTRDFLVEQFDFEPDVCAEKPSPEGVADGIVSFGGGSA